jgi:hypothetical protein
MILLNKLSPRLTGHFPDGIVPGSYLLGHVALHERPIHFLHCAILELFTELAGGADVAGHHERPGSGTVEAMWDS